jgi:hypothetical protein
MIESSEAVSTKQSVRIGGGISTADIACTTPSDSSHWHMFSACR